MSEFLIKEEADIYLYVQGDGYSVTDGGHLHVYRDTNKAGEKRTVASFLSGNWKTITETQGHNTNVKFSRQFHPDREAHMENSSIETPVATLISEHGGKAQILIDDGCYVLALLQDSGLYRLTSWIFPEAHRVLTLLPNLRDDQPQWGKCEGDEQTKSKDDLPEWAKEKLKEEGSVLVPNSLMK